MQQATLIGEIFDQLVVFTGTNHQHTPNPGGDKGNRKQRIALVVGLDIEGHDLEIGTIVTGLQAQVMLDLGTEIGVDVDRGGNEALAQKALGRTYVGFVTGDTLLRQAVARAV